MSNISRRHFVAGLGLTATDFVFGQIPPARAQSLSGEYAVLPIPALIDLTLTKGVAEFNAQKARHEFTRGISSATYGYSASFLGPVLKVRSGMDMQVKFTNELEVPTSVHWHGIFIPSELDGGPHNLVAPAAMWEPVLSIRQRASTAWFHPHPHKDTARQVHMGLAGMVIIEDEVSDKLKLPKTYGIDDIPLILQDREFDDDGRMTYDDSPMAIMHGSRGSQTIVNGAIDPYAGVPKGLVRFRLLNGANARNFWLSFDDGRKFHVIASDNGFLERPVLRRDLTIAPGERFEIVVDFTDGKPAVLQTYPDDSEGKAIENTSTLTANISSLFQEATPLMTIIADGTLPVGPTTLPERLLSLDPLEPAKAVNSRTVVLDSMMAANQPIMDAAGQGSMANMDHSKMGGMPSMKAMNVHGSKMQGMDMGSMDKKGEGKSGLAMGMKMSINGKSFDMARVDADPKQYSFELWKIQSTEMGHPFHIHGASFRIVKLDGAAPPEHLSGWKDTVLVGDTAELLVKFDQPATAEKPFMYHCHILEHEDAGMMAQYKTV